METKFIANAKFNIQTGKESNVYECIALPLNEPSNSEISFMFDSLPRNKDDLVNIVDEHDHYSVIGRLLKPLEKTDKGLKATFELFNTTLAKDTKELIDKGVKTGLSIFATAMETITDSDGINRVHAYNLEHIGIVMNPAFDNAKNIKKIGLSKNNIEKEKEKNKMENQQTINKENEQSFSVKDIANKVVEEVKNSLNPKVNNMMAQFSSMSEFMDAYMGANLDEKKALNASFSENIMKTSSVPKDTIRPHWIEGIQYDVDASRKLISTIGTFSLPNAMSIQWLQSTNNIDEIVKEQTEGETLAKFEVTTKTNTATVKTVGVEYGHTWQVLRSAEPSFLAHATKLAIDSYARLTEKMFVTSLVNKAVDNSSIEGWANAGKMKEKLWDASIKIETATGRPASFMAVATDVFSRMGIIKDLFTPKYGTVNANGTLSASSLEVEIDGVKVIHSPFLPVNTILIGNDATAKFGETGLNLATQDDINTLESRKALWSFVCTDLITHPNGLIKYTVGSEE